MTLKDWKTCVCVCVYPVYDAGSMQVFDATEHLIKQVGESLVVQLHLDDLAQVRIHQLHHQITEDKRTSHTWVHINLCFMWVSSGKYNKYYKNIIHSEQYI